MLDMTAASEAVRIATQATYLNGLFVGMCVACFVIMLVSWGVNSARRSREIRNEYMKTLTDSEYRKYNEMLNKQKE